MWPTLSGLSSCRNIAADAAVLLHHFEFINKRKCIISTGINETCILVMLLDGRETSKVQQAFIKIKNSMEDLVTTSTTQNPNDLAGVTEADKQYFQGRFREALRDKETFNGLDEHGKLKHYKWDWYEKTWDLVMKKLREGYDRLDRIIRQGHILDEDVKDFLETIINKYETCVEHMQDYKRIWTDEILPRQEEQSRAWKANPLKPASLNPYGVATLNAKLDALKALTVMDTGI